MKAMNDKTVEHANRVGDANLAVTALFEALHYIAIGHQKARDARLHLAWQEITKPVEKALVRVAKHAQKHADMLDAIAHANPTDLNVSAATNAALTARAIRELLEERKIS